MKKNTSESVEFYVPKNGLDLQAYIRKSMSDDVPRESLSVIMRAIHHIARYRWAAMALKDCPPGNILDVACGAGYGSYILAEELPHMNVIGGDYDQRAVDYARTNFSRANLSFVEANIVEWSVAGKTDAMFNYIVSFDTIEHIHHRDIALINIAEHLREDGALLFSTPCGHSEPKLNPPWEHHKIEYSHKYIWNLMSRFFDEVLTPDNGSLPCLPFWENTVNNGKIRYYNKMNPLFCKKPIKIDASKTYPA